MDVERSADFRGDAGMGAASASRSALSLGLAEEPVGVGWNAVQPRRES